MNIRRPTDPFLCPNYEQLAQVVRLIDRTPLSELQDKNCVLQLIRGMGLSYDPRGIYGEDNRYMNDSRFGMWQQPDQFADLLCLISNYRLQKIIEIGTFKGWTTTLMAAYLRRFNPKMKTLTIDPNRQFYDYAIWTDLEIEYRETTSVSVSDQEFDLCFIDGEHSYSSIRQDYECVGKKSSICILHDINEELCPDVGEFWRGLKMISKGELYEFTQHPNNLPVMGLGVIIRERAVLR